MRLAVVLAVIFYNLTIITGTAYAIQFWDWSPWWFIVAFGLLMHAKGDN